MDNQTGRVLKADDVRIAGTFHLDLDHSAGRPGCVAATVSSVPQVQIVETNNDFAVIEFTCSCGTATRLRCEYAERS